MLGLETCHSCSCDAVQTSDLEKEYGTNGVIHIKSSVCGIEAQSTIIK